MTKDMWFAQAVVVIGSILMGALIGFKANDFEAAQIRQEIASANMRLDRLSVYATDKKFIEHIAIGKTPAQVCAYVDSLLNANEP